MAAVRILHLHSSFNLGSQESRTVRLMNHFGDQAEHTVLSAVDDAFGAAEAIDRRVKVTFPKDAAPSLKGRPAIGRYRQLAQYMKKFHLVLTYNWGAMDAVMAHTLFTRSMGLPPLIHHEDGFNDDEIDRLKKRRNWFRTIALQRSNALVVPSKTLEHIARTIWHQPLDKICRFPNGIDTDHFNRRPQRGSFPGFQKRNGEIVVGTIAGLRSAKNLPRLVRAVASAGPNVRLAIVGDGPERGAIMAEAERLGIADRVMVMYGGQVVEHAPVQELFSNPQHPYTAALLKTIPSISGKRAARLTVIEGQPPLVVGAPTSCPFRERCAKAMPVCAVKVPTRYEIGAGHDTACLLADPLEVANAG